MHAIPGFTDTDRLGLTVFASILVHMVVILGITFAVPKIRQAGFETMEITLVQTNTLKAPDNPQFLAQANQAGGGDSERSEIAQSPLPVLEMAEKSDRLPVARATPQEPVKSQDRPELLTQREKSRRHVQTEDPRPDKQDARREPESAGLMEPVDSREERARLVAEISRSWQEYQKMPRHKYLNARTQEYKYAAYMDAWRAKVERIGNLNYPEEAKRRNIAGSLVLDVALRADGSLHEVTVRRPSGHKVLDDAAVRIVELAAPYAPLPADIRAETDILHITRTWKFRDSTLHSDVE